MANLIKPKITVSAICIAILIVIPLLQTNFFATVKVKRWGAPLTWNDFTGIPPIFSKYDAAINSNIYLDYDSTTSGYYSYAAQFDTYSWTRASEDSSYLLNHEQYHFNIAELHARMMNDYIKNNPSKTILDLRMQLATFKGELNYMQAEYDDETAHSTIVNKQRLWEYRIDSLLQRYSPDSGLVRDDYSGARVYFSSPPEFNTGINSNQIPYRQYQLFRYGMELSMFIFQHSSYINENLVEFVETHYKNTNDTIRWKQIEGQDDNTKVLIITRDTSGIAYHEMWFKDNANLIRLFTKFTTNTPDTTGYFRIARSFIDSFSLTETNQFWLKTIETGAKTEVTVAPIIRVKPQLRENCMVVRENQTIGFYKIPLYNEHGMLLIPFDAVRHPDSLVNERYLLLNNEIFTYESESKEIIYSLPLEKQPKKTYSVNIGYTIKGDSSTCTQLYNQVIEINPQGSRIEK